jgi:hypothetical protein
VDIENEWQGGKYKGDSYKRWSYKGEETGMTEAEWMI